MRGIKHKYQCSLPSVVMIRFLSFHPAILVARDVDATLTMATFDVDATPPVGSMMTDDAG